jgi:hypothetical protein
MLSDKELFELIDHNKTKELQKLLEEGLNVDFYFDDGLSPLGIAIMNDNVEMTELLFDYSSVFAMKTEHSEYDVMDMATQFKSQKVIFYFLNLGLNFYHLDLRGFKPEFQQQLIDWKNEHNVLLDAIKEGNLELVQQYSQNSVLLIQENEQGENALFLAFYCDKPQRKAIFEHLMNDLTYPRKINKHKMNKKGEYVLTLLADNYHENDNEALLDILVNYPETDSWVANAKSLILFRQLVRNSNYEAIEKYLPTMNLEKIGEKINGIIKDFKHSSMSVVETCEKAEKLIGFLKEKQQIEKQMLDDKKEEPNLKTQKLKI